MKRRGVPLWAPLDLCLAPGEALLISGNTGIGKSSLLQLMAGLLPPDKGQIKLEGQASLVMQDPDLQLIREMIGPEVALWLENQGVAPDTMVPRVRQALDDVGLTQPFSHPCQKLSLGQQYRLLLACQLVVHPQLLLLDEPWGQLDQSGFDSLLSQLHKLKQQGIALVISDHCHSPYAGLCDRNLTLTEQGLIPSPPEEPTSPTWHNLPKGRCCLRLSGNLPIAERQLSLSELSLHSGEAVVLCGANGAGKTSLLRAIAGLGRPRPNGIAVTRDCQIGFVGQSPAHQLSARTVAEELAMGLYLKGLHEQQVEHRVQSQLQQMGLADLASRSPQTLSYGQQHLVAIAAQLCLEPDLLLLDDPFAGLDALHRHRLWLALKRLVFGGTAVLIASHHPIDVAVHHWQFREGRLVAI